jgi:anti-sigma regulatory factor (Ser/Thr protein kinase)
LKRAAGRPRLPIEWRLDFAARQSGLNKLLDRFEEFGRTERIPAAVQRDMHLALDEIVSNIIRHGSDVRQPCRVSVEVMLEDATLSVKIADTGRPFNPIAAAGPDMRASVMKRPSGGLGIKLVKALMDKVEYSRRNRQNQFLMRRSLRVRHR